jgi:hypothetical protein
MGTVHHIEKSFDSETTRAMMEAFDNAWRDLEASGNISVHSSRPTGRATRSLSASSKWHELESAIPTISPRMLLIISLRCDRANRTVSRENIGGGLADVSRDRDTRHRSVRLSPRRSRDQYRHHRRWWRKPERSIDKEPWYRDLRPLPHRAARRLRPRASRRISNARCSAASVGSTAGRGLRATVRAGPLVLKRHIVRQK